MANKESNQRYRETKWVFSLTINDNTEIVNSGVNSGDDMAISNSLISDENSVILTSAWISKESTSEGEAEPPAEWADRPPCGSSPGRGSHGR